MLRFIQAPKAPLRTFFVQNHIFRLQAIHLAYAKQTFRVRNLLIV